MKKLCVKIHTWNVGNSEPLSGKKLLSFFDINQSQPTDMYCLCLQEIETGVVETAKSFVSFDNWTKAFVSCLSRYNYFLVENVRVQGISLSLFAHLKHLPFIRYVKTDIERTGELASTWGNKGGVAISVKLYDYSVCFLNTHLAAHLQRDGERIEDFNEIIKEIEFGDQTILDHDIVFWAGDLNFRIDEISREDILSLIEEKSFDRILEQDQLRKHLCAHKWIADFVEGPIIFPPTYKFDRECDVYDTSEKQRKPAWTDRILYKVHPEKSFVHGLVKKQLNRSTSQTSHTSDFVQLVEGSYKSLTEFKQSDHRPVVASYLLKVPSALSPLVELQAKTKSSKPCDQEVTVTYRNGVIADRKDYLALYEEHFTHFRDYKDWSYVDENTEVREVTKKFKKVCRFASDKADEEKSYLIGYYSERMSCLLDVTSISRFPTRKKNVFGCI